MTKHRTKKWWGERRPKHNRNSWRVSKLAYDQSFCRWMKKHADPLLHTLLCSQHYYRS